MSLQSGLNQLLGMTAAISQISQRFPKQKQLKGNDHMKDVGKQKVEQKQQFSELRNKLKNDPTFSSLSPAYQELALKEYAKGEK